MSDVTIIARPAAPTGAATAVLFDTTADPGLAHSTSNTLFRRRAYNIDRVTFAIKPEEIMIFKFQTIAADTADAVNWITINGGGDGETIAANSYFWRDNLVTNHLDDFRLLLEVGGAPDTWNPSVRLICGDRSSGVT